jgi:2,4-diketo-3-deoxy-L-fuconate hydrolase
MKFVIFSRDDRETRRVGVRVDDTIHDLTDTELVSDAERSGFAALLGSRFESGATEEFLSDLEASSTVPRSDTHLHAPLSEEGRLICFGGVYTNHLRERGVKLNRDPNQWLMPETAIIGPDRSIELPDREDNEVLPAIELGLVIGKGGKYIDEKDAVDHIAGYTIVNDVTERGSWPGPMGYKMLDTFSPCGPHVVTRDEVEDPLSLDMEISLDGESICRGSTAGMHFTIPFLVSYLSTFVELRPGDILATGDPGGIERSLQSGSTVELTIETVGSLSNDIRAADEAVQNTRSVEDSP